MDLIVSVDENWGIGKDNQLLVRISADLKRFRKMTTDNIIIMGRKTLESFPDGKPLPNRINIVMTHNHEYRLRVFLRCVCLERRMPEKCPRPW